MSQPNFAFLPRKLDKKVNKRLPLHVPVSWNTTSGNIASGSKNARAEPEVVTHSEDTLESASPSRAAQISKEYAFLVCMALSNAALECDTTLRRTMEDSPDRCMLICSLASSCTRC